MNEEVTLTREVDAIQIPSGDTITLPEGTPVVITQTLGGTYTVATSAGLARIASQDADCLGIDTAEGKKRQEESDAMKGKPLEDRVWHAMTQVFDPEIPVDIVNLGLVYDCQIDEEAEGGTEVTVKMTLTAPGCGMGPVIAADAQAKIMNLPEVEKASVDVVWEPAWNQDMISEEGKMKLGMM